jgi:hypothetical protein
MSTTAGSGGSSPTAGSGAVAGSGGSSEPSFQSIFTNTILGMCGTCHKPGLVIGSPDFSTAALAYASLVNKDATMEQPGQCGGKGKLITPGNCDTSLLFNKISQATPTCGRRMPPGTMTVPQAAIDEVCAWIKAGAKNN